jgi:hypothetical protein
MGVQTLLAEVWGTLSSSAQASGQNMPDSKTTQRLTAMVQENAGFRA